MLFCSIGTNADVVSVQVRVATSTPSSPVSCSSRSPLDELRCHLGPLHPAVLPPAARQAAGSRQLRPSTIGAFSRASGSVTTTSASSPCNRTTTAVAAAERAKTPHRRLRQAVREGNFAREQMIGRLDLRDLVERKRGIVSLLSRQDGILGATTKSSDLPFALELLGSGAAPRLLQELLERFEGCDCKPN